MSHVLRPQKQQQPHKPMQLLCLCRKFTLAQSRSGTWDLQITIELDTMSLDGWPVIEGFQADGERYVKFSEDTATPSILKTIANVVGSNVDDLVAQGQLSA